MKPDWLRNVWKALAGAVAAVLVGELCTGCATIHQSAETAGTGTNAVRRTELTVRTLGDAKQMVEKLRASNGTTQSLGASGVEQESTSAVLGEVIKAAFEAGKGAAK
jgi:hypothetical protein